MARRDWLWMLTLVGCAGCAGGTARDTDGLLFRVPPTNTITAQPPTNAPTPTASADHSPYSMVPPPQPQMPPQPAQAPAPPTPSEPPTRPAGYWPPTTGDNVSPSSAAPAQEPPSPPPPPAAAGPSENKLLAAMRSMLDKKSEDAVVLLNSYSPANQEVLLSLLTLCAEISDDTGKKPTPDNYAVAIQVMERTAECLRDRATLVLDKMCFCKWIEKFGVFETLPEGQPFTPGSLVHIYVELRNFASVQREQCYETHLASTVKLLDAQNKIAAQWGFTDRTRPERSQTLRHDYFINYSLRIPENIPPGKYKLLLRVDDLPTKRSVERPLGLDITARPAGAD